MKAWRDDAGVMAASVNGPGDQSGDMELVYRDWRAPRMPGLHRWPKKM